MKHLALFSSLLGAFCLAAPVTGWSRDRGHHHHGGNHGRSSHCGSHYSHRSYGYCGPSISYRSYRPSYYGSFYPSYGYGYSPYSYYSSPSIALSYTSYRDSRSADYDDDLAVDVQRALARRGYYRGSIDGEVGPGTRGAIREYQYRNRLEVTGRIDRSLLRSLGLS
jgi:His-Xaa-Ser repeat protein HxsA